MTLEDTVAELAACRSSLAHFCDTYGHVREGIGHIRKFQLWPAQRPVADALDTCRFVVSLKARQLGLTWIGVHDALRLMLFYPRSQVGCFSLREEEACKIIERVKFVYEQLPEWMRYKGGSDGNGIEKSNTSYLELANGSSIQAFSTSSGDSYTFALVIVDEADLIPNLTNLLGRVRPTIDVGGRIHLISRANKELPNSTFKMIYRMAVEGGSKWKHIFLPWSAHPLRTQAWYDNECREAISTYGNLDYVFEQYPASPAQALAGASADKRIPAEWITACYRPATPIATLPSGLGGIPSLRVYQLPEHGRRYWLGGDPAEGNPTSDESAAVLIDDRGEEVACLRGRTQPRVFADYVAKLAKVYNAEALIERNNHGHAVLLALQDTGCKVMAGLDGNPGWLTNNRGKAQLYSDAADAIRTRDCTIHTLEVSTQLSIINGSTLSAPPGEHDDLATAYAVALAARTLASRFSIKYTSEQKPQPRPQEPVEERFMPVFKDSGRGYLGIG